MKEATVYTRVETTLSSEPEPFDTEPVEPFTVDTDVPPPARPWRMRLRRLVMPLPVAAGLWAAADAANSLPQTGLVGAATPAAVYLVAAMGYWKHWGDQQPETTRKERRRWATTVVVGGTSWLLWAATLGPSTVADLVLIVVGCAVMIPYWDRNSPWQPAVVVAQADDAEPMPIEVPEAPEMPTVEVCERERTANQQFWDTAVEPIVPQLRGTSLVDPVIAEDFEDYTIQLRGGEQKTATAQAAGELIASAWGRSIDGIQVLPHPTGRQDLALLRIATRNLLEQTFWYPGAEQAIDMRGGNINVLVGHRGNGTPVWWQLYVNDWGAKGGCVFGDTGSGKTELLSSIIVSAAHTGVIAPVVGCPQNKSFRTLRRHGHWSASSPAELLEQARGLWKAHETRTNINELRTQEVWVPTPKQPLLLWVVDEIHTMRAHAEGREFYKLADAIDRAGRVTGIRLLAGDQNPSVPLTFGNEPTLRDSLLSSQCATLRLGSTVDSMVPGMLAKPTLFPAQFPDGSLTAGLGAMVGEAETFRAVRIPNLEEMALAAPKYEIEKATATRIGPAYTERFTRKENSRADRAAELVEADPDLLAEIAAEDPTLAAALPAARARLAQRRAAADPTTTSAPQVSTGAPVGVPRFKMPALPKLVLMPSATPTPKTWTCLDRVEDALRRGIVQFGEIHEYAVDPDGKRYVETSVRNALKQLVAKGRCRDGGHSRWEYIAPAA